MDTKDFILTVNSTKNVTVYKLDLAFLHACPYIKCDITLQELNSIDYKLELFTNVEYAQAIIRAITAKLPFIEQKGTNTMYLRSFELSTITGSTSVKAIKRIAHIEDDVLIITEGVRDINFSLD